MNLWRGSPLYRVRRGFVEEVAQVDSQSGTPGWEAGRILNTTAPHRAIWSYHACATVSVAQIIVRAVVPRFSTAERTAPVITPGPAGRGHQKRADE